MNIIKNTNKKNVLPKLLAIFAAVILWLYVMNEQNPVLTASYNVNVGKQKLASNMVLTSSLPDVRVKISAPRSVLSSLSGQNIKAYINLDGMTDGTHTKKVIVQAPVDVQVLEVVPDSVKVSTDKLISRSLPISINFYRQALQDFDIEYAALTPNVVVVEGAQKNIDRVAKIEAVYKQLDSQDKKRTLIDIVAVDDKNIVVDHIKIEPQRAYLAIEIKEKVITKTVPIKMTLVGNLTGGYKILSATTNPDKIDITGSISDIKEVKEIITDNISLDNLQADFKGKIKLILPKGIQTKNDAVEVDLKIQK